jgi:hypothetical protein
MPTSIATNDGKTMAVTEDVAEVIERIEAGLQSARFCEFTAHSSSHEAAQLAAKWVNPATVVCVESI